MNKREAQKEARRLSILSVSLEMFVKRGYHGTTIRDIAKEVGMSPGLMFHYFETKDTLYLELLKNAATGVSMQQRMQMDMEKTPLDLIEAMVAEMFYFFENREVLLYFVLVKQTLYSDFLTAEMEEIVKQFNSMEQLVPLIEVGQQMGQFKNGDALELSVAFFSTIQGIAETKLCFPEYPTPSSLLVLDLLKK